MPLWFTSCVDFARRLLAPLLALVLLQAVLVAQTANPPSPDKPDSPAVPASPRPTQQQGAGVEEPVPTPQVTPSPVPQPTKITPEQLKQLTESVDDILKFASEQTGLPVRSKVKVQLRSRADVQQFIEDRLKESKDTARLEQAELVMKKLALLPPDFNLKQFIVKAYGEQVAGYYDAKTKSMCLLDWVPFDEQRPVMAHELTHALQDQRIELDKWMDADSAVSPKESAEQRDAALDEVRLARDSVVEGQAMIVLWNYNLLPMGRNVQDAEDLITAFTSTMLDAKDSPEMASAPLYIKRGLIFPYREGFEFVRQVLIKRGKTEAFGGILDTPPVSSRQVMQPETYLRAEKIPQLKVPDFKRTLGADWVAADFGAMGQIDVSVMLQLYVDEKLSKELAPQWRGGYYYAARKKGAPDSRLGVLYVSRWADEASAARFVDIFSASWKKRYKTAESSGDAKAELMTAKTEEGSVSIARQGDIVVAIESFPDAEALKLRQASFAANKPEAMKTFVVPMSMRPALDVSAYIGMIPPAR